MHENITNAELQFLTINLLIVKNCNPIKVFVSVHETYK